MITVATRFDRAMDQVVQWVSLTQAAVRLSSSVNSGFRSTHQAAVAAKTVAQLVQQLGGNYSVLSYEGAYLSACAEYETTVRQIIESFILELNRLKANYIDLPPKLITSHHKGCVAILSKLNLERYSHLKYESVVSDMFTCLPGSSSKFQLRPEAFSDHDHNLKACELTNIFDRIGLGGLWNELSTETELQTWAGTSEVKKVLHRSTNCLNDIMDKRNRLMHQGSTGFSPGPPDVTDCATFFKTLIRSLESATNNYLSSI